MKGPFFLWTIFLLAPAEKVFAQSDSSMARLTCDWPKHNKHYHIAYTPFGSFEVLDNRTDTTRVFTNESFGRPPVACRFDTSCSVAIRRYLEETAGLIQKGPHTLLLRIQMLNLPNKGYWLYRARSGTIFARYRRNDLICEAQAFYKTENGYRKLFDATLERYQVPTQAVSIWVADILNELLQSASVVYAREHGQPIRQPRLLTRSLRNSLRYRFLDREKLFSITDINKSMRLRWSQYPVFSLKSPGPGKYGVFEDFRAARADQTPLQISFDTVDSVYRVRFLNKDSLGISDYWGISDGHDAFLKIGPNAFLKLVRLDSTYVFFVPHTMPDICAQLTPVNTSSSDPEQINLNSLPPNVLGTLGAILIVVAINEAIYIHAKNRAAKEPPRSVAVPEDFGYRYGWLEMNTGDILYKKP